jgi:L-lactate dehydrogenase complex protein LldE
MLISLFVACYNDTLFPETGKAVVRVLERLGHTVEFRAAQTCCGQMHYNTGYHPEAVSLMRHFLEVFQGAETICIPSASCVAMIREHFPRMAAGMKDEPDLQTEVDRLLPRVYEFTELLIDKLGVTDVGAEYTHSVTLHTSCHALIAGRARTQPDRITGERSVLRIRRHFRHQERGRVGSYARRQDARHSRHPRRGVYGGR